MPEIDIPGHSMAFLAAYPQLSTTPNYPYQVNAGDDFNYFLIDSLSDKYYKNFTWSADLASKRFINLVYSYDFICSISNSKEKQKKIVFFLEL